MDELEAVEKLAQLAREERAPMPDVSARVLMRIRMGRGPLLAPFWFFTVASAAVAAGVMTLALRAWISWNDPLVDLFTQLEMVVL